MRFIFGLLALFFLNPAYANTFQFYQTENIHNQLRLNTRTGELYQIQSDGQKFRIQSPITVKNTKERYELIKTRNMWTYILLDSFSGKLWQCQYSVQGDSYRFCKVINNNALSSTHTRKFSVQPLTSMYQFYLINQQNGDMWKFQWSSKQEDGYIWIEKI